MSKARKDSNLHKKPHARPDAVKSFDNNTELKARFWLEKNGEIFLASGRIELLKKLDELGSISSAAESMGMSYNHAWKMIDKMNELAKEPLITTSQGGKGGGGTELTPRARLLLKNFDALHQNFQNLVAEINLSFKDDKS